MNERLIQVMEHYGFSPSIFADEIGVLRSSVSHILSGRNKPGLDLVQKVLARFPDLSAEWLMLGAGDMLKAAGDENGQRQPELIETSAKPKPADKLPLEYFIETSKRETGPSPDDNKATENQAPKEFASNTSNAATVSSPESRPAQRSEQIQLAAAKSAKVKRITLYYDDNSYQDFFPG